MAVNADIENRLAHLSTRSGVYRMLDEAGDILYVGKAKNLKSRVSSYFRNDNLSARILSMVSRIRDIECTITETEAEALLLEISLIKRYAPRYNVVLRDDKSYPYIYVSVNDRFPRLAFDRGKKQGQGRYFGPYPSAGAVRETLSQLQKLFQLRQCEDSFFRNRSRPCLQYQIKRCTAPCVGYIDEAAYRRDVEDTLHFLQGRSDEIIQTLMQRMDQASENLEYEAAIRYRDQIQMLRKIFEKQTVVGEHGDMDVIAVAIEGNSACVNVFFIRKGRGIGNKSFFPRIPEASTNSEVIAAFIPQYYANHDVPNELLLPCAIEDSALLEQSLSAQSKSKVSIVHRVRDRRARLLKITQTNAESELKMRLSSQQRLLQRFEDLQQLLELENLPQRIECFDISHTQGEATVAACVVFDHNGPVKSDYRRFNIKDIKPGDDYAAMHQALERRYLRLKKGEGRLPDVLLIDGGKGQVAEALQVLEELQIDSVLTVGVAKGPDRRPGNPTRRG